MKDKVIIFLYKIWVYILNKSQEFIKDRISIDKENMYVVYYSNIVDDLYICPDGETAIKLYNLLTEVNKEINRPFTKILYGKVKVVFKYKMAKLTDVCFTWNATDEQRRDVCKYIADVPLSFN